MTNLLPITLPTDGLAGCFIDGEWITPERSLEVENPSRREVIADALIKVLGQDAVIRSELGPTLSEEAVTRLVHARPGGQALTLVPCEVTAVAGMVLLRKHGALTVNTHGQLPGYLASRSGGAKGN
ncbi:hypothetical protein [Candidatus Poriferisodalis sp.]|uniref:hypothetical protein n=1 Tax=Candidatus Poriferisodalis sp. TaxID=3101277 RepID=UPI003B51D836